MKPSPSEVFQKDELKRTRLKQLLADPILVEALAALKDELDFLPGGPAEVNPVLAASRYHQGTGMSFTIKGLHSLTEPPAVREKVKPKIHLTQELPKD